MGFHTTNDPSIKWLHVCGQVWFEVNKLDICWLVRNFVAREVVKSHSYVPILGFEMLILEFDPSVTNIMSNRSTNEAAPNTYSSK